MNECGYCKDRKNKIEKYEEDIEKQMTIECLKALEREKIANGMQCTKRDEIQLREIQKMQMLEKKRIEQNQAEIDNLWHQELLNEVRLKEEYERMHLEKLKQEMIERRTAYDDQIASANRKRREAMQNEREIENRRLEKMKKRMEQDYYEAIKRKKHQQMTNKRNYIEGHEIKISRIKSERMKERELDNNVIYVANRELEKEKWNKLNQIKSLQVEEKIFKEKFNHEKTIAKTLENESNIITNEWKVQSEQESDKLHRKKEMEKYDIRMKAAEEYKRHIEERKREIETKIQERKEAMERVKQTAYNELREKLDNANDELKRQDTYRNSLKNQIKDNQTIMELELSEIERKQRPFTKKAIMFKEAMKDKFSKLSSSENPVHPFKKAILSAGNASISLPCINK